MSCVLLVQSLSGCLWTVAGKNKGLYAYLIIENFYPATSVVEEPENLIFKVEQPLLVGSNASHEIVVTLF